MCSDRLYKQDERHAGQGPAHPFEPMATPNISSKGVGVMENHFAAASQAAVSLEALTARLTLSPTNAPNVAQLGEPTPCTRTDGNPHMEPCQTHQQRVCASLLRLGFDAAVTKASTSLRNNVRGELYGEFVQGHKSSSRVYLAPPWLRWSRPSTWHRGTTMAGVVIQGGWPQRHCKAGLQRKMLKTAKVPLLLPRSATAKLPDQLRNV